MSCLGKPFTAVLNKILNYYADCITLLSEAQTGFRKGYSTSDNIFVLSSLIEYLLSKGKKMYCAFIDFKKAFDTVWREGLWQKVFKSGIREKKFELYIICIQWQNHLYLLTIQNPSTLCVILG